MQTLTIKSAGGDYAVEFAPTVAKVIQLIGDDAFVVCDAKVAEKFGEWVKIKRPLTSITATEGYKTLSHVENVCYWLGELGATKRSPIVAVGGGVTQDVATMAAHLYLRGINLVLVPTTLLAQADSCIGSKAGINLGGAKNQLGCFRSPSRVIVCPEFLTTLDDEAIRSGYGEILKLSLVDPECNDWFDDLETHVNNCSYDLRMVAAWAIRKSLSTKRGFIEGDEFEKGDRIWLSYGHTFGHALEAVTNHAVPHGIAVAWGIDVVNFISMRCGALNERTYLAVRSFIKRHLPYKLPEGVTAGKLVDAIRRDKKADAYSVTLALLHKPGEIVIHGTTFHHLHAVTAEYLSTENVYA